MSRPSFASAVPLISASQISQFRDCQRKWAWAYVAGIRSPSTPSQALGTEVHDTQLGPYLLEGRPFDYTRDSGYIAAALLEYLPEPKTPGMVVEKHFVLPSPASEGKFAYQGYLDLWVPPDRVIDFKTTSDLKWAKNPAALSVDVQAMLYATNALYETKASEISLEWLYTQTRGARRAKRTYLRVDDAHVITQFRGIEETALELFAAKQTVTDPLSLPPSPSQCEAYGGCPYRDKCNLSPADHIASMGARDFQLTGGMAMSEGISSGTSSLLANLKARKAGVQGAVANTAVAPDQGSAGSSPAGADVAPSPSASPEPPAALGINPPEQALPPPETAKRGPGRPKKVKTETVAVTAEPLEDKQIELPFGRVPPTVAARLEVASAMAAIDYEKLAVALVDVVITRIGLAAIAGTVE